MSDHDRGFKGLYAAFDSLNDVVKKFIEVGERIQYIKPYSETDISATLDWHQKLELTNFSLESGQVLTNVHSAAICEGQPCAIHHPSDHPLKDAPRSWAYDMILRECACGAIHPDFDSLAFQIDKHGGVDVGHLCCDNNCCGLPDRINID